MGAGPETEIIESGQWFAESEFIDRADGSEHLNQHGRRRLADAIVKAVNQRRSSG
jgi:hypothetical protein